MLIKNDPYLLLYNNDSIQSKMNTRYYLPNPKDMPKKTFKTKFFRALFFIPGIKFNIRICDRGFPNIPEEYISRSFQPDNPIRDNAISCFTVPENKIYFRFCSDCPKPWFMKSDSYWSKSGPTIVGNNFDDCDFSSDDTKKIAYHLLGPSWKTLLDDSIYNIQKNRFVRKYHLKKLLIESIECLSIVKYVLVSKLIELEAMDETTHIRTALINKHLLNNNM